MKFGIVSDEIDRDFAAAVSLGKSLGIERYEIRNLKSGRVPACDPEELLEVQRIAGGEGVEITAISPGLFKLTDDEAAFRTAMSEVYPAAAELANRWKLPGLIVFGFHKPGVTEENFTAFESRFVPSQVIDWFSEAATQAGKDGLLLMIEPEPICWVDTSTIADDVIRRTGAKSLRINYDPGNVAWLKQSDPLDEFPAAAPWIANVHIKDLLPSAPGARPCFVPAGHGMVDFRKHFAALKEARYNGPISLEPHIDGALETIRKCKEALEHAYEGLTT